jgi:hypothetical protein
VWLSDAADNPQQCRDIWENEPWTPQLLPTRRTFDAMSVDLRLGIEAVSLLVGASVPTCPTLVDYHRQRMAFLVPIASGDLVQSVLEKASRVRKVEYRYLGSGSFVVIAGPAAGANDRFAWLEAPLTPPDALTPAVYHLANQLVVAGGTVASAESFGGSPESGGSHA